MNILNSKVSMLLAGLIHVAGIGTATAELPALNKQPWLGYFVVVDNNRLQFGILSDGKASLRVTGKKDEPVSQKLGVKLSFVVEETLPDGKVIIKTLIPESLESSQPATDKPKNVTFRGKVKGDAVFEVSIDEDRGKVFLGGRLIDRGTLTVNPTRFSIQLKFPDAYPNDKNTGSKKEMDKFEEKISKDRVQLTLVGGKRVKLPNDKPVDTGSKEINGPGIDLAEIEFSSYKGKKMELDASGNSMMTLTNSKIEPLHGGFTVIWAADPAKDPEGKARLTIDVK
jgi:hypothetical protein